MPDLLPLAKYSSLISLTAPFKAPQASSGSVAGQALDSALSYIWHENRHFRIYGSHNHTYEHDLADVNSLEIHQKIRLLVKLLTVREPASPLPEEVKTNAEIAIAYINRKKPHTAISSIPSILRLVPEASTLLGKISVWRGDITALLGVTAIVNAVNERMLGCFKPGHKCIDNVIHSAAGPRLREDCKRIMDAQGRLEPNGVVKVTRGYLLPAKYVLHTAGPKVPKRSPGVARVSEEERADLEGCYKSCLEAIETLEVGEGEEKTVAFCCVGAGLFGYPHDEAVHVAVDTVLSYLAANPATTINRVIFNVFTSSDFNVYTSKLNSHLPTPTLTTQLLTVPPTTSPVSDSLALAIQWLRSTPNLLITAGAGLSASDGLDYTSRDLFRTNFPGMWERGFTCLYDLFDYNEWSSPSAKWGYYFSHIIFVRGWVPPCGINSVYTKLRQLVTNLYPEGEEGAATRGECFIRTSNPDCLFARNGFSPDGIATPQGTYELLRCVKKCRPDAYWPVQPFVDAALPYLDPEACVLREDIDGWEKAIPACAYCGAEAFLCVRSGDYSSETPFVGTDRKYREFLERAVELVVLELGAGFNTAGVIRWEDESLVRLGGGAVKLVRVGMNGDEEVEWALEGDAVSVEGDAGHVVGELLKGLGIVY